MGHRFVFDHLDHNLDRNHHLGCHLDPNHHRRLDLDCRLNPAISTAISTRLNGPQVRL